MISVVHAGQADREALATLLAEAASGYADPGAPPAEAALALTSAQGRAGPFCLLARNGAAPLGFAALSGFYPASGMGWGLLLNLLFVTEAARGRGVARPLMDAVGCFAHQGGYTRLDWQTRAENARARAFYAGLGARATDRLFYRIEGATLAAAASGNWPERIP
jgi:GNAT superfamily N-acetyltransferase